MVRPHDAAWMYTPATIAETFDGVSTDLYCKLWQIASDAPEPFREIPDGPEQSIAKLWDRLTEREQHEVNALIERQ